MVRFCNILIFIQVVRILCRFEDVMNDFKMGMVFDDFFILVKYVVDGEVLFVWVINFDLSKVC